MGININLYDGPVTENSYIKITPAICFNFGDATNPYKLRII